MRFFITALLLFTINIAVSHNACVNITLSSALECPEIAACEICPEMVVCPNIPDPTVCPEVPITPETQPPVDGGGLLPPVIAPPTTPATLPLLSIDDMKYQGAFTFEANSGFTNTDGKMTLNTTTRDSLFVQGKWINVTVGEYSIPELVNSNYIPDLNKGTMLQNFITIVDRTDTPNKYNMDRVGGMQHIDDELLIHMYRFYASGPEYSDTTVVFREPENLNTSNVDGYFQFEGKSNNVLWISPVPPEHQAILGGNYISGASPNDSFSINGSKISSGPNARVFNSSEMIGNTLTSGTVKTTELLGFENWHILANNEAGWVSFKEWYPHIQYNYDGCCLLPSTRNKPEDFHDNYDINLVGNNDIWTDTSGVAYGFIVPDTKTYAVFGYMSGHKYGAGYKIQRKDGKKCGGPCNYADDAENYYWFFNVDDLIDVKNGLKKPYEIKPYSYGKFETPFDTYVNKQGITKKGMVKGGTYDTESKILYLNIPNINDYESRYYPSAVVMAYKVDLQ